MEIPQPLFRRALAAAAAPDQKSDDDQPDDVVVIEDIAKAISVHGKSSLHAVKKHLFSLLDSII